MGKSTEVLVRVMCSRWKGKPYKGFRASYISDIIRGTVGWEYGEYSMQIIGSSQNFDH